jgi:RNA polymerase sigma-70 factor (ECF subfamily)
MTCLTDAWTAHAHELRGWLRRRVDNPTLADDLLQDLFLKGLRQGERFCSLHNARAWLFEAARKLLADQLRVAHHMVDLPDGLTAQTDDADTVDT